MAFEGSALVNLRNCLWMLHQPDWIANVSPYIYIILGITLLLLLLVSLTSYGQVWNLLLLLFSFGP